MVAHPVLLKAVPQQRRIMGESAPVGRLPTAPLLYEHSVRRPRHYGRLAPLSKRRAIDEDASEATWGAAKRHPQSLCQSALAHSAAPVWGRL
eukprot:12965651-Alexandrium_andersonii.AAC.1